MTRAERIRNMTTKEMAKFFCHFTDECDFCPFLDECTYSEDDGYDKLGFFSWLEEEVKEGDDLV